MQTKIIKHQNSDEELLHDLKVGRPKFKAS